MITFTHKGDYSKATKWFERLKEISKNSIFDKYGQAGVNALMGATPVESGLTAASWSYEIEHSGNVDKIIFSNSNINKNVNIAIILQYGHGTGTGGWVQGRDYINPAIRPVFDKMVEELWGEVTKA